MALWTIASDSERRGMNLEERMWGYTGAAGLVQALATGYFLFDLVAMVRYLDVFGYGMLAHALSCLVTYTLGFVGPKFKNSKIQKKKTPTSRLSLRELEVSVY
jgi:hypothetical protein